MDDKKLEKIDLDEGQIPETEATEFALSKNKIETELKSEISDSNKDLELHPSKENQINKDRESENISDLNIIEKKKNEQVLAPEKKVIEAAGLSAQSSAIAIQKRREEAIDKILAEGLNDIFLKMSPLEQKKFQAKGEETTKKISLLLNEPMVSIRKIIDLIKKWLKLIPGVNKFFLEQETKLKVDKIIKMKNNF